MKQFYFITMVAIQWIILIIVMIILLPIFWLFKGMDKWKKIVNLDWN